MVSVSTRDFARLPFLLTASLAAIAIATPALAQDQSAAPAQAAPADTAQAQANGAPAPAAAANDGNGEIVVTAQFREQNLQDTPLAITAVNSAMLEARSQTNVAQVAAQAPSVTLKPQGTAYGPSMTASIRGIG